MDMKPVHFSLLFLLFFSILPINSSACSLAIHNWKLIYYTKINLPAPIFPLAEIDAINEQSIKSKVSEIVWVTDHTLISRISIFLFKYFSIHVANLPWKPIEKTKSVLALARKSLTAKSPKLILGSDNIVLKLAFFSDKNSNFNCHQLVLMQEDRIRAIVTSTKTPWAQEVKGKSWVSLIFYRFPLPGYIVSFAAFPYKKIRKSIFDDHNYVERLLLENKLQRRTDIELDPLSNDFPKLPE